jgi:hypothetical protein
MLILSCKTLNTNNDPGNSLHSVLIIIDKGVVELQVKSRIVKNIENNFET